MASLRSILQRTDKRIRHHLADRIRRAHLSREGSHGPVTVATQCGLNDRTIKLEGAYGEQKDVSLNVDEAEADLRQIGLLQANLPQIDVVTDTTVSAWRIVSLFPAFRISSATDCFTSDPTNRFDS